MVYKSGQTFQLFCHNSRVWQTDRQTEFSSPDRICIPCSAVNMQNYITIHNVSTINTVTKVNYAGFHKTVYKLVMKRKPTFNGKSLSLFNVHLTPPQRWIFLVQWPPEHSQIISNLFTTNNQQCTIILTEIKLTLRYNSEAELKTVTSAFCSPLVTYVDYFQDNEL